MTMTNVSEYRVSTKQCFAFGGHLYEKRQYKYCLENGQKVILSLCRRELREVEKVVLPGGAGEYTLECPDCMEALIMRNGNGYQVTSNNA